MFGIGLAGLVTLAVVVLLFYVTITKLMYVSTPNEVLIFSGSVRRLGRKAVGYRFVRGGRSIRRPFIEQVDRIDLNMITVVVSVELLQLLTREELAMTLMLEDVPVKIDGSLTWSDELDFSDL